MTMTNPHPSPDTIRVNPESWKQAVRAAWHTAGNRLTEPRARVLDAIVRYSTPFSAEQLYADLGQDTDPPGRATVYRTIEQLNGAGWLARIHTQAGESGYVPSLPGHLHHLICTNCGVVIAFAGCALDDLLTHLASQTDFAIEGHLLQLYGRCARCKKNSEC
ncbi:MAG: transcriptional repressor [Oscillochloris sp.]|nr:transcriptional repressor [Oscillochloris sp.]